jgi:hypothetical protein
VRVAVVVLAGLLVLAGCGAPDDETRPRPTTVTTLPPEPPRHLPDLPVGTAEVGPGHRVQAQGSFLVVDGRRHDLAPLRVDEVAVVRGGVFFRNGRELWFTDLRSARPTGYDDVRSLVASSDGRRVAFVDLQHGPKDRKGTPLATAIAYDATSGRALVASYAGMGDVRSDDLAALYARRPPAIAGFSGDDLLVQGATGDQRIPLDGAAPNSSPSGSGSSG